MGIATQSEQRYRRLFDGHYREVYAYCRRRTDAQTAADAATETFLVAWRRLDVVPDGEAALGWLYGVARRVLANEYRANQRRRSLLSRLRDNHRSPDATPEMVVVRRERDERVRAAMARLRPEEQELLRLALWEQIPHREIAASWAARRRPSLSGSIELLGGSSRNTSVSTVDAPWWGGIGSCGEVRRHDRRRCDAGLHPGRQPDPDPR